MPLSIIIFLRSRKDLSRIPSTLTFRLKQKVPAPFSPVKPYTRKVKTTRPLGIVKWGSACMRMIRINPTLIFSLIQNIVSHESTISSSHPNVPQHNDRITTLSFGSIHFIRNQNAHPRRIIYFFFSVLYCRKQPSRQPQRIAFNYRTISTERIGIVVFRRVSDCEHVRHCTILRGSPPEGVIHVLRDHVPLRVPVAHGVAVGVAHIRRSADSFVLDANTLTLRTVDVARPMSNRRVRRFKKSNGRSITLYMCYHRL